MPNYDKQRQASAIYYVTAVARIDGHTAAKGFKREYRFDRELQDWVPGREHTVPWIFGYMPYSQKLGQN